jgi:Winged helix DNA-binding domain
MAAVPRIDDNQRRARLGLRHFLAPDRARDDPVDVARGLVALHATDPATVHLAAAARMRTPLVKAIEDALYEQRTLIRMLGMRRTMFVVPTDVAPIVQAACTDAIALTERRKLVQHLGLGGIGDERWLAEVESTTLAALAKRGSATAAQLAEDEPRLRTQLVIPDAKTYGPPQNITTRVLTGLAAQGRIVRGRPRGSWISSQYLWSPVEEWLPAGLPPHAAEPARTELARRWLEAFGPGTTEDLKWWSGWTMGQARSALAALGAVKVRLDSGDGYVLAEDVSPAPEPGTWVALLPALDPTLMGWVGRDWYLGEHGPALFDRSGNPGPTVWSDGRIVGGWAQRPDGRVAVRLLSAVGKSARSAIDEAAEELTAWLGPVRVTPRFRTPLERELSG